MKNNNITNRIMGMAVLILSVITQTAFAKTVYTSKVTTGNWGTSSTWTKTGTGSPVVYNILSGNTITLNVDVSGPIDSVIVSGKLIFSNDHSITMASTGIVVVYFGGIISGGNNESRIDWPNTGTDISGPFNGTNLINGAQYANKATTLAASGVPQGSFVDLVIALPVVLKSITVEQVNNAYELNWITVDEESNTTFIVEVSENGKDFYNAGTRTITDETGDVTFSLNLGNRTKSFYTRLTRAGSNGSHTVISLQYTKVEVATEKVQIFPTVLENNAELKVVVSAAGDYTLDIYGSNGVKLASKAIHTETGSEVSKFNIAELNLTSGMYIATVTGTDATAVKTKILVTQ